MKIQTITNNQLCILNISWWTVLLLRNAMEIIILTEEEVELCHSSSFTKISIFYIAVQKIQKNQLEISSEKILIFTSILYFCPFLFPSLNDGLMKCRVVCKGIQNWGWYQSLFFSDSQVGIQPKCKGLFVLEDESTLNGLA